MNSCFVGNIFWSSLYFPGVKQQTNKNQNQMKRNKKTFTLHALDFQDSWKGNLCSSALPLIKAVNAAHTWTESKTKTKSARAEPAPYQKWDL